MSKHYSLRTLHGFLTYILFPDLIFDSRSFIFLFKELSGTACPCIGVLISFNSVSCSLRAIWRASRGNYSYKSTPEMDVKQPSKVDLKEVKVICNFYDLRTVLFPFKIPLFIFSKSPTSNLLHRIVSTERVTNNSHKAVPGDKAPREAFLSLLQDNMHNISKTKQWAKKVPVPKGLAPESGMSRPVIAFEIDRTVAESILEQMKNSGCKIDSHPYKKEHTFIWESADAFPKQFVEKL